MGSASALPGCQMKINWSTSETSSAENLAREIPPSSVEGLQPYISMLQVREKSLKIYFFVS